MIANMVSWNVQYYEEDKIIAMEIANRSVYGIKWRFVPVEVKEVVFIP